MAVFCGISLSIQAAAHANDNSVGMKMIRIESGSFMMGSDAGRDYWDESPRHRVKISRPFYISETEVTVEQYRQFRPDYTGDERFAPYATGVSWYDAVAFCEWLSEKEGKTYRLPTEAEWEYACRAGTASLYWSGGEEPQSGQVNPWGLLNMHSGPREWCHDWFGSYIDADQTDPVGPVYGMCRVVRGGGLDDRSRTRYRKIFNASASRAGIAPAFGRMPSSLDLAASAESEYQSGLAGVWFGESDFRRPQSETVLSNLDNDWQGTPRGNRWSAKWQGWIEAPHTGIVRFEMKVNSMGTLKIDGKELINQDASEVNMSGEMEMVRGKKYPLVLTYVCRGGGDARLKLSWHWAERQAQVIPSEALFHTKNDIQRLNTISGISHSQPGNHWIGFRVVQGDMPATIYLPEDVPFVRQGVRRNNKVVTSGPDSDNPFFRKRYLLPVPLDNSSNQEIDAAGLHPSFRGHNHSPALEVCPNGDVLMIIYTSYSEYEPGVSLIAARLRFGADQWDMPERLFDFPSVNDHAPMLWTNNGQVHFFWGCPKLDGGYPFQRTSSGDSGATWDEVKFPLFINAIGSHSRQPINTALRNRDGSIFVASDGRGGESVLWASHDEGKTWHDTGGRSAGRHTTYALLKDGYTILGMGGKNTDIDGYMPQAVSHDGGKSWEVSKTCFPAQGTNQRPSVLRLASGRLFFAGDFQHFRGKKPNAIMQNGSYVALSEDDGENWIIKKLPGAQQHENPKWHKGHETIGYSAARQAPNGMIHLIATMNRPCLHFEFNEAWILDDETAYDSMADEELMASSADQIQNIEEYKERLSDGTRIIYYGGIAGDGRFLLHGEETWYYPNGRKQYQATYDKGQKVGREILLTPDSRVRWRKNHNEDGSFVWIRYWPDGGKKSETTWRNFHCDGPVTLWDTSGEVISQDEFKNGQL